MAVAAAYSTAPEPGPEVEAAADPESGRVLDLALSKGKMKRLKEIAAQKGIDSAGASRPELVQRILSAAPRRAAEPQDDGDVGEANDASQPPAHPRVEYSEQLKQLSKAYHELITRLVAQGNNTAVDATLTRARAAGVEDWVLNTALEQQPMPNLEQPGEGMPAPAPAPAPESAELRAERERVALEAAAATRRREAREAEAAEQRQAEEAQRIERAVAEDDRSTAEVRAACRVHGLSATATRGELLRRLLLHERWDHDSLGGQLPADLDGVTLEHYTAAQLKIWCTGKGLSHSGNKGDLIERLSAGTSGYSSHLSLREIGAGALQKYDLWGMNQSGNARTTFIGIKSSVCYVDLGPGHIDQMDWVSSARRVLNLQEGHADSDAPRSNGLDSGSAAGFWEERDPLEEGDPLQPGGGRSAAAAIAFSQKDLSLPRSVHGYLAKESLPGAFGREQLRTTYDAILAYLVPQAELHGAVTDPMDEAYENMQRAERMVHIAERSLHSGGSVLIATGRLALPQALELVDRMDQSFVDVMELSHGSALVRAQKVMNILMQRANMSVDRQRSELKIPTQTSMAPLLPQHTGGGGSSISGTVESIEARRLVEKWLLPENRQSAAAASSLAAFGASGPSRYQQSEERTDEMITRELGGKNRLFEPDTTDLYLLLGKNRVERFGGGQEFQVQAGGSVTAQVQGQGGDLDWQLRLNGFAAELERQSTGVANHGHRLEQQAQEEGHRRWAKPGYVRFGSSNDNAGKQQ